MSKKLVYVLVMLMLSGCMSTGQKTQVARKSSSMERLNLVKSKGDENYKEAALINVELGIAYLSQGDVPRAKKKIVHALDLNDKSPEANAAMAYFLEQTGELERAEKFYLRAIDYSIKNKGAHYNNYGVFLCNQKRYSDADAVFLKGIADKKYFRTSKIYENAGICALNTDSKKAREYLETALLKDPKGSKGAYLRMATLSLNENKPYEALHHLKRFEKLTEPTAESTLSFIKVADKIKDDTLFKQKSTVMKENFADSGEFIEFLEKFNHG